MSHIFPISLGMMVVDVMSDLRNSFWSLETERELLVTSKMCMGRVS